jgi:hypothetical protein
MNRWLWLALCCSNIAWGQSSQVLPDAYGKAIIESPLGDQVDLSDAQCETFLRNYHSLASSLQQEQSGVRKQCEARADSSSSVGRAQDRGLTDRTVEAPFPNAGRYGTNMPAEAPRDRVPPD